jgi:F-type H+-transporting ATPase subunit delta
MAELSTLARPYARAAFEYAAAAQHLQSWSDSLSTAAVVVADPQVAQLLDSPSLTHVALADTLVALCGDQLSAPQQNFSRLLAENGRLPLLGKIAEQFEALKANREQAVDVDVVSAIELDDAQQQALVVALGKKLERKVNMQVSVDKSLLGGALIRAGDTVIDGSIRGRLAKLAESLNS